MRLDAVIVNYRVAPLAVRSVRSILAEDRHAGVTVVDNSEDAGEAAYLRSHLPPECRLLVAPRNDGFGAPCNRVFAESRAEAFLLLNPDAYLLPGALAPLVDFLRKRSDVGCVSPLTTLDATGHLRLPPLLIPRWWHELAQGDLDRRSAALIDAEAGRWRARHFGGFRATEPYAVEGNPGGHILLRRSAVIAAGGLFDPRFFMYYEDTDLAVRLARTGYASFVVPTSRAVHQARSSRHPKPGFKERHERESAAYYMAKHFGRNWRVRLWRLWLRCVGTEPWRPMMDRVDPNRPWPVPGELQDSWMLEIGSNPFLLPACWVLGSGPNVALPKELLGSIPRGVGFARLASPIDPRMRMSVRTGVSED